MAFSRGEFLNLTILRFLAILTMRLSLILQQSLLCLSNISAVLQDCKQKGQKYFCGNSIFDYT